MTTAHDYSLELARIRVQRYRDSDDELMSHHREAMECRACEDFLQLGIDAFHWLSQADEVLREAAKEGLEVDAEAYDVICALYKLWLHPCDRAEQLASQHIDRGYTPDNVAEFRTAVSLARKQVEHHQFNSILEDAANGRVFDQDFLRNDLK